MVRFCKTPCQEKGILGNPSPGLPPEDRLGEEHVVVGEVPLSKAGETMAMAITSHERWGK